MKPKEEILICDCSGADHQLVFRHDKYYQEENVVFLNIYLTTNRNFWSRLKYGLKYAFGYKSKYGAFDEIIITNENYKPMENAINHLKL